MRPIRPELAILAGCAVGFGLIAAGRFLEERATMPPLPYPVPITSVQYTDMGAVCIYFVPGAGVWGWTKAELGLTDAQLCPNGAEP